MLEGSVLVRLLNSIIIQSFCLCDFSWIYLESILSFSPISTCLPNTEWLKGKKACTVAVSAAVRMFPSRRLAGCRAMSPQGGVDEVRVPRHLPFLGHWQVQENLCLTLMLLLFFEQDRVRVSGLWFFLFKHQGFSHLSAVPCHSYHLGGVLIGQRIRTSIKPKSKWPEPIIQEVSLVLSPTMGLRRRHLVLPK